MVAVIYQDSPSTLLSSKRAADRHVCSDDNGHMEGLDINRFKAPLRQTKVPLHLFYSSVAQICGYVDLYVRAKLFFKPEAFEFIELGYQNPVLAW